VIDSRVARGSFQPAERDRCSSICHSLLKDDNWNDTNQGTPILHYPEFRVFNFAFRSHRFSTGFHNSVGANSNPFCLSFHLEIEPKGVSTPETTDLLVLKARVLASM